MKTTPTARTAPAAATDKPVRLITLKANNFMRLTAVEIRIGDRVTTVTGRNAQGKSSVLNAIASALGGKRSAPERPIRKGAKSAEIIVETTAYTITRRFTDAGTSLHIAAGKAAPFNRPQELLDRVLGDLSFDPLAFMRYDAKRQTETLLDAAGLRERFDAWQAERDRIEAARLEIGRDVKRYAAEATGERDDDAPAEPVSVKALTDELQTALDTNRDNAARRAEHAKAVEGLAALKTRREQLAAELAALTDRISTGVDWVAGNEKALSALHDVDTDEISARIDDAERVNAAVRNNARLDDATRRHDAAAAEYKQHTDDLAAIEAEKAAALEAARFPVRGLTFGPDGLLLNGQPFTGASQSEQIRASVAIGLAQNPGIRLMMVRDGSLLDDDAMNDLARIADEQDAQIIVERVGTSVEGCGVLIDDGAVVDAAGDTGT